MGGVGLEEGGNVWQHMGLQLGETILGHGGGREGAMERGREGGSNEEREGGREQ